MTRVGNPRLDDHFVLTHERPVVLRTKEVSRLREICDIWKARGFGFPLPTYYICTRLSLVRRTTGLSCVSTKWSSRRGFPTRVTKPGVGFQPASQNPSFAQLFYGVYRAAVFAAVPLIWFNIVCISFLSEAVTLRLARPVLSAETARPVSRICIKQAAMLMCA